MKEKVTLLEYSFSTVFHEDGVEEDGYYIYAARAYGKKTRLLGSRGEEMVREGREELLGCAEGNGGEGIWTFGDCNTFGMKIDSKSKE